MPDPLPPIPRSPRKPFRWGRFIFRSIVLLIVVVVGSHAIWGWVARHRLNAVIASLRARGEWTVAADLVMPPVPSADNAAIDLRTGGREVSKTLRVWEAYWKLGDVRWPLLAPELEVVRKVCLANQPALDSAAAAWHKPAVDWQLAIKTPVIALAFKNDLTEFRQLCTLLQLSAWEAHARGNDAEVVVRIRQILRASRAIDEMRYNLIPHLVAVGGSELASATVLQLAPELQVNSVHSATTRPDGVSREQLKELVAELLDESPLRAGFQRAMSGERVEDFDSGDAFLDRKLGPLDGMSGPKPAEWTWSQSLTAYALRPVILSDNCLLSGFIDHARSARDAADLPSALQKLGKLSDDIRHHKILHLWANIWITSYDRSLQTEYKCLTSRRLAATSLAIRAYSADHAGHLPSGLVDLVPDYLPAVPLDPMIAGSLPLKYLPREADPIVYGVGVNAIDDGGSDQPSPGTRWDRLDIIAHLKTQPREDVVP